MSVNTSAQNFSADSVCHFRRLSPIAIFMAVPEEAQPLLKMAGSSPEAGARLGGIGSNSPIVWHLYVGQIPVVLCLSGMGFERADKAVRQIVQRFKPCMLISSGFAGGLREGLEAGCVAAYNALLNSNYVQPSEAMLERFAAAKVSASAGIKAVSVRGLTSAKVVGTAQEKERLHKLFEAEAVDMEAGAIAGAASEFGLPWAAIKVISDTCSENMPLNFEALTDKDGQVDKFRAALAVLLRPAAVPQLLRMAKTAPAAAENLGRFLAYYIEALSDLVPEAAE